MPLDGHIWRKLHVRIDADDRRTVVRVALVDGIRVHREEVWGPDDPAERYEVRALERERYYTTDPDRAHRTLEAALAATLQPIEPNEP